MDGKKWVRLAFALGRMKVQAAKRTALLKANGYDISISVE